MSKKELARLRTLAHIDATPEIAEAFDNGHKMNAKQARIARKKAAAAAAAAQVETVTETVTVEPEWSPLSAENPIEALEAAFVAPVVEDAPVVADAPVETPVATEAPVYIPFVRTHLSWMKANLQLTAETRAALEACTAKVHGKAVFLAFPEAVQAELVQLHQSQSAAA